LKGGTFKTLTMVLVGIAITAIMHIIVVSVSDYIL
jgi:hypothetical protein